MRGSFAIVALTGTLLAASIAAAEPSLRAVRTAQAPKIDGKLDDAVWQTAQTAAEFTQNFPDSGKPPSEPTVVRVLYDDRAVYVGIDCTQRLTKVVGRLGRRDRQVEADAVSVALDSRADRTTAFEFSVNAAGVLRDVLRFNDTDSSSDWDELWEGAAARTATGWSAELAIPLRALRFDSAPEQSWGMQVRRYISERRELDEWAFIPSTEAGEVSHYGRLTDLARLRPRGRLQLRPFLLASGRWSDLVPQADGMRFGGSAGLDLKAHLTQNLVFDLALNPDFGQVEADQAVLNLTTFETYYPEKRPFFLEGIDTFSTPLQLLYTRRVGRPAAAPVLRPEPELSERALEDPTPPPIYGAAKLLGTLGRRLSVGTLSALLGPGQAAIETAGRQRQQRVAEPLTLQNALRLKLAIASNAHIGLLATAVNHFEQSDDAPHLDASRKWCPSGDAVALSTTCFGDSYVAALDGRWRSASGRYVFNAQAVLSAQSGGPPRLLRDGTVLRSGDVAPGGYLQFAKEGGEHFTFYVQSQLLAPKLDFNGLGFMRRQNELQVQASAEYRTMKPWRQTQETHTWLDYVERENLRGLNLERSIQANTFVLLKSFWGLFADVHYKGAYFDDREVGDGTALERADLWGVDLAFSSDRRKPVNLELWTQAERLRNGWNYILNCKLTLRPRSQLELQLEPQALYTVGEPRYIGPAAQPGELLLGSLEVTSIGATLRANYTFTPRLTLQLYGQLLLAARHYEAFWSYRPAQDGTPRIARLSDLQPAGTPQANPDGTDATLNLSAVLRWEYLPGSVLFFVYSRSQAPSLSYQPGETAALDTAALRKGPGSDALLVKWSYWYG